MDNNGLPPAYASTKDIKFGNLSIKTERPTQNFDEAKKGLDKLEKAAQEKVFVSNDQTE